MAATGEIPVGLYLDHGGTVADGEDGLPRNLSMRDQLVSMGWVRGDAPDCALSSDGLCYYHDVGATHDELAWKDRAHLFLRYFFAP